MDKLLWIGHRQGPSQLQPLLAEHGVEMFTFTSVDEALTATEGMGICVAIVAADWKLAVPEVQKLSRARPEIQILLATDFGIPRNVVMGIWGGASGVLEFRNQTRKEIVGQICDWVSRHDQAQRERQLLLRLRALNEEFLRNMVAAQKRNMELEEKMQPEAERIATSENAPVSVLVVDDEEVVRSVLEAILTKKHYTFESVDTGEAAVEAFQRSLEAGRPFNLVISDKNLPGMTGLDLLKQIKEAYRDTDFILMTGYASMDSAIDALNSGAAAYLEKPFDHVKYVLDKIEGVLDQQRERNKKRHYLHQIKERNGAFLDQYRTIRADLEAWLQSRGALPPGVQPEAKPAPAPTSTMEDNGPRPWND